MERNFSSAHLEKDFHTIMEFNKATLLDYEIKETKDRDRNKIFELTISTGSDIIDTYTYYNYEAMVRDIDVLETKFGIEMDGLLPY